MVDFDSLLDPFFFFAVLTVSCILRLRVSALWTLGRKGERCEISLVRKKLVQFDFDLLIPLFVVQTVWRYVAFSFQPFGRWAEKAGGSACSLDNE